MHRRKIAFVLLLLILWSARGGEIIFVDPVREKAQALEPPVDTRARTQRSLEQPLEHAREHAGRGRLRDTIFLENGIPVSPAAERARAAGDYLEDVPTPPSAVILKSASPTDAAKAKQTARSWIASPAVKYPDEQCKSENIVGGIEGQPQGRTVIQSSKGGVSVCK